MTQQAMNLNSDTDKVEVISHIVNKLLYEVDGPILFQHARSQTIELIEDNGGSLSMDDFDRIVQTESNFTVGEGNHGQKHITDVDTTGRRPDWLDAPDMESQNNNGSFEIPGVTNGRSPSEKQKTISDDLSELDSTSEHQPDALKEEGFNTYRSIAMADVDELTEVAGVNTTQAKELREEASEFVDPIEDIAREAYAREATETNEENTSARDDAHLVTDVPIPAGEPRDPAMYENTNMPWHVFGLPVLEKPTLNSETLSEFVEATESFGDLLKEIEHFTTYGMQFANFKEDLLDTFDSFEALETAMEDPVDDAVENLLIQTATTETHLTKLITEHDIKTNSTEALDIANDFNLNFENELPDRARVHLIHAIKQVLEADGTDTNSLTDDGNLSGLVEATNVPIELDHPFIEAVNDFPPIKTRTLETGERDIEAAARIMAKDNYALDLVGHAGVGKDTLIRYLCAATNRPTVVINMDESMISQDLMGIHKIDENGKVTFKDGVIPHSSKYGYTLIISEVNAAAPEILMAFHQLLERNSKLHVKERDEVIEPSPKFKIATTRNPPTRDYDGAKKLNGAFKRRLNSLELDYLNPADETDLIDSMVNETRQVISKDDIRTLVDLANEFRKNSNRRIPRISTSKILHIADVYDGTNDLVGAVKESIRADIIDGEEAAMDAIEDKF